MENLAAIWTHDLELTDVETSLSKLFWGGKQALKQCLNFSLGKYFCLESLCKLVVKDAHKAPK